MTMQQFKSLQKKLIRAAVLLLLAIAAVLGIDAFSSRYVQVMEEDLQAIETQITNIRAKYNQSLAEQKTSLEAIDFFKKYAGSADYKAENFSKTGAMVFLNQYRERYGLNDVQISLGSFVDQPATKKENAILSKSNASIKVSAAYDIPIYNLLASLDKDFPGDVVINSLAIKKNISPDAKNIADISSGKNVNVVSADIKMDWYQTKDLVGTPISIGDKSAIAIDANTQVPAALEPIKLDEIINPEQQKPAEPKPAEAKPVVTKPEATKPANNPLIPPLDPAKPNAQNSAAPAKPAQATPKPDVTGGQALKDLIPNQPEPSLIKPVEVQIPRPEDLQADPKKGGSNAKN
jgi:hypothetical protein